MRLPHALVSLDTLQDSAAGAHDLSDSSEIGNDVVVHGLSDNVVLVPECIGRAVGDGAPLGGGDRAGLVVGLAAENGLELGLEAVHGQRDELVIGAPLIALLQLVDGLQVLLDFAAAGVENQLVRRP